MKPIKTKGTNAIFGAEGYSQLPGQIYSEHLFDDDVETECVQTVWELSEQDLDIINACKKIYVSMVGTTIQPISVDVIPFAKES